MIRITPTSIAHCIGFCLVAIYGVYWFTNTAVSGPDRFMNKKNILTQNRVMDSKVCSFSVVQPPPPANQPQSQVIGYFQNNTSQPILATHEQNIWSIDKYDAASDTKTKITNNIQFAGTKLSLSYQPIYNLIAFPQCNKKECDITIWSVADEHEVKRIAALDGHGGRPSDINNLFFDPEAGLVSYTTTMSDISSRVVLSYEGRLLQSIDESPGADRQLQFIGYLPESKQLVYQDARSKDRILYSADSISLVRQRCSP